MMMHVLGGWNWRVRPLQGLAARLLACFGWMWAAQRWLRCGAAAGASRFAIPCLLCLPWFAQAAEDNRPNVVMIIGCL